MNNSSPKKELLKQLDKVENVRRQQQPASYKLKYFSLKNVEAAQEEVEIEGDLTIGFSKNTYNPEDNESEMGTPRNGLNADDSHLQFFSKNTHQGKNDYNTNRKIKPLRNYSDRRIESSFGKPTEPDQMEGPHIAFREAVELSPSVILMTDRQGVIEYANPKFLEVCEYTEDEIIGRGIELFKPKLSSHPEYWELKKAIIKGRAWKGELENSKKSGESYIFSASITPVRNEFSFITNFILVGQDITPFRDTEKQLNNAIEEKTVLLAELHHRVKNNLAIISGLMQLQAFSEKDAGVQSKLLSSVSRVQTMASMHELLYETGSFSKLEFGQNVKNIVNSISKMYYKEHLDIKVILDIEPVQLSINQAHPCSLVINEIVTNAFKHAFHPSRSGKIRIQLYTQGKIVYISIVDNGSGLPKNYDTDEHNSLGNKLLKTLVKQLGGTYSYSSNGMGTSFTLSFCKENGKGSSNAVFA